MLIVAAELVFAASLLAIAAPYVLYPLSVLVLARCRRARPEPREFTPSVTLLISAYNEAAVIGTKIENSLALDYPAELLEILVISDASDDGTDEIVAAFGDPRITLCRQETRGGKTKGITSFMPQARGDVVVFSDANSIYDRLALRYLTRHFSDPQVGYVVGYQQYLADPGSPVSVSEDTYWRYEAVIKESESRLSSVVGGDGAIYAIRRHLFVPLLDDEINDFVTPLQIIAGGYRGVYEKRATCTEHTAADFPGEFRRKVRIVNRSLRGVLRVPATLNPFRVGWFAYQLFVHKVLRWLVPLFLISLLASSLFLAGQTGDLLFELALLAQLGFYGGALLHYVPGISRFKAVYLVYYFCLANFAAALGVLGVLCGRRIVVWQPQRERSEAARVASSTLWVCGISLAMVGGMYGAYRASPFLSGWEWIFWASLGLLAYGYVGYWTILRILPSRKKSNLPVTLPAVSLIIPAYNEERCLAAKLRNAVEAIDYPRDKLEIIVASDGSSDATLEIARSFESRGVRLLDFPVRRGKASVLNDAVAAAAHEVLCLCDANVIFEPQALRLLVAHLADPTVGAVTGDVRLESRDSNFGEGESVYCRLERDVQCNESRVATTICVDGGMYVLRRELYLPLPADTILDDFVTSINVLRGGKRVVYDIAARARENGTPLGRQEFRRRMRVAAGAVQAMRRGNFPPPWRCTQFWQFVSHKLLRWTGPVWLALLLATAVVLQHDGVVYRAAFAAQMVFYSLALAATISVPFRGTRLGGITYYFTMSHVAIVFGTVMGLFNLQRAAWNRTERSQQEIAVPTATGAT